LEHKVERKKKREKGEQKEGAEVISKTTSILMDFLESQDGIRASGFRDTQEVFQHPQLSHIPAPDARRKS